MVSSNRARYSGNIASEYPAYWPRFLLRYRQLRKTRPDLLLKWIETTDDTVVERVALENRKIHLQFKQPWSSDPGTSSNNYTRAEMSLVRSCKMQPQPDIMAKYGEKMQAAINEGHLLWLPNKDSEGKSTEPSELHSSLK